MTSLLNSLVQRMLCHIVHALTGQNHAVVMTSAKNDHAVKNVLVVKNVTTVVTISVANAAMIAHSATSAKNVHAVTTALSATSEMTVRAVKSAHNATSEMIVRAVNTVKNDRVVVTIAMNDVALSALTIAQASIARDVTNVQRESTTPMTDHMRRVHVRRMMTVVMIVVTSATTVHAVISVTTVRVEMIAEMIAVTTVAMISVKSVHVRAVALKPRLQKVAIAKPDVLTCNAR
jgi:hypothetical protein